MDWWTKKKQCGLQVPVEGYSTYVCRPSVSLCNSIGAQHAAVLPRQYVYRGTKKTMKAYSIVGLLPVIGQEINRV